jgi:hypothetical protein
MESGKWKMENGKWKMENIARPIISRKSFFWFRNLERFKAK